MKKRQLFQRSVEELWHGMPPGQIFYSPVGYVEKTALPDWRFTRRFANAFIARPARRIFYKLAAAKLEPVEKLRCTVLIPVRNRANTRLENLLASIRDQKIFPGALQALIVDFGSSPAEAKKLVELAERFDAQLLRVDTLDGWNRSRAVNSGLARVSTPLVAVADVDLLFEPEFFRTAFEALAANTVAMVAGPMLDLPDGADVSALARPGRPLRKLATRRLDWRLHPSFICLRTAFLRILGGFNEEYPLYGSEDRDMYRRLLSFGLDPVDISAHASYFHQWHEKSEGVAAPDLNEVIEENRRRFARLGTQRLRNPAFEPIRAAVVAVHDPWKTPSFLFPFEMYGQILEREYGARPKMFTVRDVGACDSIRLGKELSVFDVVIVQAGFLNRLENAARFLDTLRAKRVIFDDADSTGDCRFDLVSHCELYLKKQLLRDRTEYTKAFSSGRVYVDAFRGHYEFEDRPPKFPPAKNVEAEKLMLGWNLGAGGDAARAVLGSALPPGGERRIDVLCRTRALYPLDEKRWEVLHRSHVISELSVLGASRRVTASFESVPREEYLRELKAAKIVVSPFGWGEICRKDFEAVAAGCLLVKPSLAHLETEPAIFQPGCYVPVEWDLRDLTEKCEYYLAHEEERRKIAESAYAAYRRYFTEREFLKKIAAVFERLDLVTGTLVH